MPGITIDDLLLYDDSNVDTEEIVLEIEQKTITPETERSRKISLADLMKEGAEDIAGDGLISEYGIMNVDNTVVRTSGDQIIDGIKTFSTQIRIPTSTPASLDNGAIWLD